jgi:hypothetical protein
MLIVCPAGLTMQWHDEMRDRFGLDSASSMRRCCVTYGGPAACTRIRGRTIPG